MQPSRLIPLLCLLPACASVPPASAPIAAGAFADADSAGSTTIAPGVVHTMVRDARGPWAIHIVEIDSARCVPMLEARKPGTTLAARATTSQLAQDAIVTINADFFMLPGGTPVGAHVTRGIPLIGPTDRQVFATTTNGWRSGVARLDGTVVVRGDTARLAQINRPATAFSAYRGTRDGVTLFTSWIGDTVPADSNAVRIALDMLRDGGNEAGGVGVIASIGDANTVTRMQAGRAVLYAHGDARAWAQRRLRGDTVRWRAVVTAPEPAQEVVGGFPELLRNGRPVLSEQTVRPEFGAQRHPRTAVGWNARGTLFLVVVDGRQPPYSDGMSLDELTWVFQRLGATDALNLDGGGSTALVIRGRLSNKPSDREGERPVGNALALTQCRRVA